MGLYETLSQSFPEEFISPFGNCLIVPVQQFREEWKNQLASEACSVFSQSYNGKVVFLVKRKDSQNNNDIVKAENHTLQLKRLIWNEETFQLIEKLRGEGYGYRRIVDELAKRGFKTNPTSVMRKLKGRENATTPKPSEDSNPGIQSVNHLGRFLEALNLLHEHGHEQIILFLLKNSSNFLNST